MSRVLLIGAGGVGTVVAHKMASLPEIFSEVLLASRTKSKCDAIAERIGSDRIKTAQVDADNVPELVSMIRSFKPDLVVNVALPIPGPSHYGCLP
jgi:saccharopine dehydrogenase (NAD+, L-lysine forming)